MRYERVQVKIERGVGSARYGARVGTRAVCACGWRSPVMDSRRGAAARAERHAAEGC